MKVVTIGKRGKYRTRVRFENGAEALIANEEADRGEGELPSYEIDSGRELDTIRVCLSRYLQKTGTLFPLSYEFDDMVSAVFLHFWETGFWGRYDRSHGVSYFGYIYSGVKNFILKTVNSFPARVDFASVRLDNMLEGSDESYSDTVLRSSVGLDGYFEYMQFMEEVSRIKSRRGSSTYREILEYLLEGYSQAVIAKKLGVTPTAVNNKVSKLRCLYNSICV